VKYKTLATQGNLNNHIGVPLTILSITPEIEFAVIEMGANHQHEIESYCRIAEPEYGLITNVGKAHLEGFGGFEGVMTGKGELYDWISQHGKAVFYNADNVHLISMLKKYSVREEISFGSSNEFYCRGKLVEVQPFLKVEWKCSQKSGIINSNLIGAYNFENILSAVCIGNYFGITPSGIDTALASYSPDNSRSQLVKRGSNTIILDAYNANPSSMEAALKNFAAMPGQHKVVFIGDMAELGDESDEEHRRISELIGSLHFEKVILVGKNFQKYSANLTGGYFEDSAQAATWVKNHPLAESNILIKGSRSMKMEKVFEAI
jgi:UDP-N-acetylmuramoyl-tripeptide--D-alanyl-D-alanine ligase